MKQPKSNRRRMLSTKLRSLSLMAILFLFNVSLMAQGAIYPLKQEICETTATFDLTWSGSGTVVNWERNDNDGLGWNSIGTPVGTTITVTTSTLSANKEHNYRAYVSLGGGSFSYSVAASVYIYGQTSTAATLSPSDASTRCQDSNVGTITASAHTSAIANWVYSETGSAPWTSLNESSDVLSINNLSTTTYFKVLLKNGVCPAVLSASTAQINVLQAATSGTASTSATSLCKGTSANLLVSDYSGTGIQWQQKISGTWTDIATATSASYATDNSLSSGTYIYRVAIDRGTCKDASNATVKPQATSLSLDITVYDATSAFDPSPSTNVVTSNDATNNTLTVSPTGTNSVVRWEYSTDGYLWTSISNTSNSLTYSHLVQSTYYRVITQSGVCSEKSSVTPGLVTVANGGSISSTTGTDFCFGSASGNLTASDSPGPSYEWYYTTDNTLPIGSWTKVAVAANTSTIPFAITQTTYYRLVVNSGKAYSSVITLNVSPATIVGSLTADAPTVCSGNTDSHTLTLAGNTGSVIRWESSTSGGAPWAVISSTATTLSYSNLTQSTWYRAVVQSGACSSSATSAYKITVASGGHMTSDNSVCLNDLTPYTLNIANSSGTVSRWEKREYNSVSSSWDAWTAIGNAGMTAYTYSNLSLSTQYRALMQASCNSGRTVVSDSSQVTVYSTSVGGSISTDATVRPGNNSSTLILSSYIGNVVRWESSVTPGGGTPWTSINNTTNLLTYANLTTTTYYRAIVANGPCAEVVSSNVATITVADGGSITGGTTVCASDITNRTLTLVNAIGAISKWQKSINSGSSYTDISGTSGKSTYTYNSLTQTTLFRAVITEDGGDIYSEPAEVVVKPLPVVNFTNNTACYSHVTDFTNQTTLTGDNILGISWDFGDGDYSTGLNPSHTYKTAATFSVKLTISTASGCSQSTTKSVTVKPLPSVAFSFTNTCKAKDVVFSNSSSLAANVLTYRWDFGDGSTTTADVPTHSYASDGLFTVKLAALASNGCADSITKNITIYPIPVPDFSYSDICAGSSALFTSKATVPTGNLTYKWDFDGLGTSTLASPSFPFNANGSYSIKQVVTSMYGCSDSITQSLTVHPNPVAAFTVSNDCYSQYTTFANNSTISGGTVLSMTYNWSFGNNDVSTATTPVYKYPHIGTYVVTLTATSALGCSNSASKQTEVSPIPNPNFSFAYVCTLDTAYLTNYTSVAGGAVSYKWYMGDNSSATTTDVKHVYSSPGNYTIKLVATHVNGCHDSISKVIEIYPLPSTNFTHAASCMLKTANLTDATTIASGSVKSWLWDFGNGSTSSEQNPGYIFSSSGSYNVKLTTTSVYGCKTSITKTYTVNAKPSVLFSQSNVCTKVPMPFTNATSYSAASVNYYWSFGNGDTSRRISPSYTYNTAGNYITKLIAVDANGCKDSLSTLVTSYPRAIPSFVRDTACETIPVAFTSTSTLTSGTMHYKWTFETGQTSDKVEPSYTFATDGAYPVKLCVTTEHACSDSVTHYTIAHKRPQVSFSDSSVCFNYKSVFKNRSYDLDGTISWTWDFDDRQTSTLQAPEHLYLAAGSYFVKLTAVSSFACKNDTTRKYVVYPHPSIGFSMSDICQTGTATFTNLSSVSSGSINYTWDLGEGTSTSSTSPTLQYNTPGAYTIRLKGVTNLGCIDSVKKILNVNPLPTTLFSSQAVCKGAPTTFTNQSSVSLGSISSYLWDFGNGSTSNLINPKYIFADSGTYAVILTSTTNYGCSTQHVATTRVNARPSVSFTQTNVCKDVNMNFVNTSKIYTPTAQYYWDFGDGFGNSTLVNPAYPYASDGYFDVKLMIKDANACKDSVTREVVSYPRSTPGFTFGTVCEAVSFGFANTTVFTGGTMRYKWTFESNQSSDNADPIYTFASDGTYPVKLRITTDRGCRDSITQDVVVHKKPTVFYTAANVCLGFLTSYNNLTSDIDGTMTWDWDFGDRQSSTDQTPEHTYLSSGTYYVKLTATSEYGCVNEYGKNYEVYPRPYANYSNSAICETQEASFDNISNITSGSLSYKWNFDNGTTSTTTSPSVLYSKLGTYNVKLVATSNYGCADSITKQLTVNPLPTTLFEAVPVCKGYPTSFVNKCKVASGSIVYYQWDLGDLTNSLQESPVHQYVMAGSYKVNLLSRTDKGCETQYSQTVVVAPTPVANFTADPVCFGNPTIFVNKTTYAADIGEISSYWDFGSAKSTVTNPTYLFGEAGSFKVKLKAVYTNTLCSDSITKLVVVYSIPEIYAGRDTTIAKGYPYTMTATGSDGTYNWQPSDSMSQQFTLTPILNPFKTQDYILYVTSPDGCNNSDTVRITVNESYDLYKLNISAANLLTPNNNGQNDYWTIPNIEYYPGNHVSVYDRWGNEVFKTTDYKNDWQGHNKTGDPLPDGTYYYVIYFDKSNKVHKGAITLLRGK